MKALFLSLFYALTACFPRLLPVLFKPRLTLLGQIQITGVKQCSAVRAFWWWETPAKRRGKGLANQPLAAAQPCLHAAGCAPVAVPSLLT